MAESKSYILGFRRTPQLSLRLINSIFYRTFVYSCFSEISLCILLIGSPVVARIAKKFSCRPGDFPWH